LSVEANPAPADPPGGLILPRDAEVGDVELDDLDQLVVDDAVAGERGERGPGVLGRGQDR